MRLVLFPWRHKPWSRAQRGNSGVGSGFVGGQTTPGGPNSNGGGNGNGGSVGYTYLPPREDVNSPDLYIPGEFCLEDKERMSFEFSMKMEI